MQFNSYGKISYYQYICRVCCNILYLQLINCYDFALFSRGDDGPRRSNLIGEGDGLKQEKHIKVKQSSHYKKYKLTNAKTSRLRRYREGLII